MFRSIQGRLLGSYVLLVLVIVILLALAVVIVITNTYLATAQQDMLRDVSHFARLAGDFVRGPTGPAGSSLALRLASRLTAAEVLLVDAEGVVRAESREQARYVGLSFAPVLVREVLADRTPAARTVPLEGGDLAIVAAAPLARGGNGAAAVVLFRPLGELHAARQASLLPLWRAGVMGTLVALLLAPLLARGISGPLAKIARAAKGLAAGDRTARSRVSGPDELGQLGQTFDEMASRIEGLLAGLTEERDRQQAILQGVSSGLFAVTRDGGMLFVNQPARELLGLDPAAPGEAQSLAEVAEPDLAAATREALARAAGGSEAPLVREMVLAGGGRIVLARLAPQPGDGGVVGILQDITEIRNLDRLRRDLVSNVSHELRTPVTSILGFLEALRDGLAETEEERGRYLEIIEGEARRLSRLIDDLFDLSKLESGQISFEMKPLELAGLVRDVGSRLAISAAKGAQRLDVAAPERVMVRGDRDRLAQVLLNLAENALRFTPPGGRVGLSLAVAEGRGAVVRVGDSGPGIHPDDLPLIFERFYTADKSRSRGDGEWRAKGTGLGLAIVKHIVEAHGGTVTAASEAGQGAVFEVVLPLHESANSPD